LRKIFVISPIWQGNREHIRRAGIKPLLKMTALGKAGFAPESAHPLSTVHGENAAQVRPQLVARHSGDALDLDHQIGVDERLAVRPVRDGLLGSSDCKGEFDLLRQPRFPKAFGHLLKI
jgi:hypothetical protein